MALIEESSITAEVNAWLDGVVIGENLCPFAAAPRKLGRIAIHISDADDDEAVLADFQTVVTALSAQSASVVETSLLVTPKVYANFYDYNDSLWLMERVLKQQGLEGILQLASFHPQYQFADAAENDAANFSNRAPYPIFHLLREDSVERVLATYPDPENIPERNIAKLRGMSREKLRGLFPHVFKP